MSARNAPLYIGASGRIGRLLRGAARLDPEAGALWRWQFRRQITDAGAFYWPDLADPAPLVAFCAQKPVGSVFVFAGVTRAGQKDDAEAMAGNLILATQSLEAAHRAGVSRVIVASSSAVYGVGQGWPFRETDALDPANAYGAAKREMELRCAELGARLGLEVCCLRIGNVAGADMLLTNARARKPGDPPLRLDVFPDGEGPRRSYIGPQSLLRVLSALHWARALPKVINLAAPHPVAMNALLDAVGVPWTAQRVPASGHQDITLDCTRLTRLLPAVDIPGSAQDIVRDWQEVVARNDFD